MPSDYLDKAKASLRAIERRGPSSETEYLEVIAYALVAIAEGREEAPVPLAPMPFENYSEHEYKPGEKVIIDHVAGDDVAGEIATVDHMLHGDLVVEFADQTGKFLFRTDEVRPVKNNGD